MSAPTFPLSSRLLSLCAITIASLSLVTPATASYVMQQVGAGTATLVGENTTKMASVSFSTLTLNRSAVGYGDTSPANPTVIEGVYYTYTFTVPGSGSTPRFDVQNQMSGLWSGWGDPANGIYQNGPTSSSWSRGTRYQHRYPGDTTTSFPTGQTPPVSTIPLPAVGDVLSVGVYLLGLTNDIDFVYSNLTTGDSFTYTYKFTDTPSSGVPTGNLSFNGISFRSDANVTTMDYTFGTLHVVPEPSRTLLLSLAISLILLRRKSAKHTPNPTQP